MSKNTRKQQVSFHLSKTPKHKLTIAGKASIMKLKIFKRKRSTAAETDSVQHDQQVAHLESTQAVIPPTAPQDPAAGRAESSPPSLPNNSRGARTSLNYRPSFHQDNHYHQCCHHCHQSNQSQDQETGERTSNRLANVALQDTQGVQSLFHSGGAMLIRVAEAYMMSYLTQGEKREGGPLLPGTIQELRHEEDSDDDVKILPLATAVRPGHSA